MTALPSEGLTIRPLGRAVGRGEPLHHDVVDDIRRFTEPEIIDPRGIVRLPAGCHNDGGNLELEGLRDHTQVDGAISTRLLATLAIIRPGDPGVKDVAHRESHLVGQIGVL